MMRYLRSEIAERRFSISDTIPFSNQKFYLAPMHRSSNTDSKKNLQSILKAFSENIHFIDPVSYSKDYPHKAL